MKSSFTARKSPSVSSRPTWYDTSSTTSAKSRPTLCRIARALEGEPDLFLGVGRDGAVRAQANLPCDGDQPVGGDGGRILEQVEDLVAADGGVVFGEAVAFNAVYGAGRDHCAHVFCNRG